MQLESTLPTDKATARTAVVAGLVPTAATGLRGMPRIDRDHRTAPFFGFVLDKGTDLRKRPTVHPSGGFRLAANCSTAADVRQVLDDDSCSRSTGLHNLFTQYVITVLAKPGLLPSQVSQMAFGRRGSLPLELAFQLEALAFEVFPASFAEKGRGTGDGRLGQSQVDAHDVLGCRQHGRRHGDDDMQPPPPMLPEQISRVRPKPAYFSAEAGIRKRSVWRPWVVESGTVREAQSTRYVFLL